MKICIVLPHFYPYVGGGEKLFYDLAKGLIDRGHQIRVVAKKVNDDYNGHMLVEGIDVWYCDWKAMFGHPIIQKKDIEPHIEWCDLVHTSIFTPAHIVSKLARQHMKPAIMTVHEVRGNKWYWAEDFIHATGFFVFEQYVCRQKFDVYHAVSESTKKDFHTFCGKHKNVVRVYNANEMEPGLGKDSRISLREYFNVEEDEKIFLYYGRPGKTKGVHIYLNAIKLLKQMNKIPKKYKFCFILGSEPADLRRRFIDDIQKAGLENIVFVRDSLSRQDLCKCIEQADYVVVPSLTEGFGFSALEACQMGKKLIYSNGCSLPEVVYGECLPFKNRDSKDLAEKIDKVIRQGNQAFEKVPNKTFTYTEMIDGLVNVYKNMLQNNDIESGSK
ncbi:MAG: glycosyltransferase family 4 protein [Bacteroidales bacterium]|nr:glycosyltransferase family 4 protein [Bacteroidales bacterium]